MRTFRVHESFLSLVYSKFSITSATCARSTKVIDSFVFSVSSLISCQFLIFESCGDLVVVGVSSQVPSLFTTSSLTFLPGFTSALSLGPAASSGKIATSSTATLPPSCFFPCGSAAPDGSALYALRSQPLVCALIAGGFVIMHHPLTFAHPRPSHSHLISPLTMTCCFRWPGLLVRHVVLLLVPHCLCRRLLPLALRHSLHPSDVLVVSALPELASMYMSM